jgi:hypothetical protein
MDVEVMGSYKNVWRWLSSQLGGARTAAHIKSYVLGGCGGSVSRIMVAGDLYEDASEEEDNDAED